MHQEEAVASRVQHLLSSPRFRCYRTTDVTGVELGGALKNVLAIACGELMTRCALAVDQLSGPGQHSSGC
jgi:glycerol-3-phosphate dehydrogenase